MFTDVAQTPETGHCTARDLVKEIAKERGYLGEEKLGRLGDFDPEIRRDIEEALLKKDEMIGSAVLTYVSEVYPSLLTGMLTSILDLPKTFTQATQDLFSNSFRTQMTMITALLSRKARTRVSLSRYFPASSRLNATRMASHPRT